ncbi:MAG: hypothetical protein Q7T05_01375 [Dehalococcoidia bacterium]|nr:hypothetical protein [Dehalococcoidia bacterium]
MAGIIRDEKLTRIADSVKLDAKRRVLLPKVNARDGVTYHVYMNRIGQIILDPQVSVPVSEAWLFEDKDLLASIDNGMADSAKGRIVKRGSFAGYSKDAP